MIKAKSTDKDIKSFREFLMSTVPDFSSELISDYNISGGRTDIEFLPAVREDTEDGKIKLIIQPLINLVGPTKELATRYKDFLIRMAKDKYSQHSRVNYEVVESRINPDIEFGDQVFNVEASFS